MFEYHTRSGAASSHYGFGDTAAAGSAAASSCSVHWHGRWDLRLGNKYDIRNAPEGAYVFLTLWSCATYRLSVPSNFDRSYHAPKTTCGVQIIAMSTLSGELWTTGNGLGNT
jgi:hypothetical protein